jgi:hypothetical protein
MNLLQTLLNIGRRSGGLPSPLASRVQPRAQQLKTRSSTHQMFFEKWKSVHALQGIGRGRDVRKDDPSLTPQFVGFAALNISNLAELREEAIQTSFQFCIAINICQIVHSEEILVSAMP